MMLHALLEVFDKNQTVRFAGSPDTGGMSIYVREGDWMVEWEVSREALLTKDEYVVADAIRRASHQLDCETGRVQ